MIFVGQKLLPINGILLGDSVLVCQGQFWLMPLALVW